MIVCDDRSTDGTAEAVTALYGLDPRVRLVRRQSGPKGPGATRNAAIHEARGSLIAFLDDDDEWFPEKLATQLRQMGSEPCLVASNALKTSTHDSYFVAPSDSDISPDELAMSNPMIASSVVVPRAALVAAGAFSESVSLLGFDDYDMWLRLANDGLRMRRSSQPQLQYRDLGEDKLGNKLSFYSVQGVAVQLRQLARCPFTRRSYRGVARSLYFAASVYLGKQARARTTARIARAFAPTFK